MAVRLRRRRGVAAPGQPEVAPDAPGLRARVSYITFPWSNEHPRLRTLSEQLYAPVRLPLDGDRRVQHADRPDRPARARPWSRTSRPCTRSPTPEAMRPLVRLYRRMSYPHTAKVADAIIINSESLRAEVERYLDVDPAKLHLIPEAVDHDLFRPGDPDEARDAPRAAVRRHAAVRALRLVAVALQELRRVCCARSRGQGRARRPPARRRRARPGRRLRRRAPGAGRPARHRRRRRLGRRRAARGDGALLPRRRRVRVPVVQRDLRPADPRGDGDRLPGRHLRPQRDAGDGRRRGAAGRPGRPGVDRRRPRGGLRAGGERCCASSGLERAQEFTWAATAERTLEVYREVHARAGRSGHEDPGHRRCRLHRLAHLRPAGRARARGDRARRAHRTGPSRRPSRPTSPPASSCTSATSATGTCSPTCCAASTRSTTSRPTRTTCPTSPGSPTSTCTSTALIYEIAVAERLDLQRVVVASSQSAMGEGLYRCPVDGEQTPDMRPESALRRGTWEIPCPLCGGELEMQRTPERISNPQNAYGMSKYAEEMVGDQPRPALRDPDGRAALQHRPGAAAVGLQRLLRRVPDLQPALPARRCADALRGRRRDPRLRQHPRRRRRQRPRAHRRARDRPGLQRRRRHGVHDLEFAEIVRAHYGSDLPARITGEYRFGDTRHIFSDIDALKEPGLGAARHPGGVRRGVRRVAEAHADLDRVLGDGGRDDAVAGRGPEGRRHEGLPARRRARHPAASADRHDAQVPGARSADGRCSTSGSTRWPRLGVDEVLVNTHHLADQVAAHVATRVTWSAGAPRPRAEPCSAAPARCGPNARLRRGRGRCSSR